MHIDLSGKSILVTGASRGIGAAIARGMAHAGGRVAIHFNNSVSVAESLAKEIGNSSQAFKANLADSTETTLLFQQVKEAFGQIDVLVNNAGIAISSPVKSAEQTWLEDWNKTIDVNLSASALLCKLAIGHFQEGQGGTIINISSRAAFRGDTEDYLAYAASKGGMVALTRSIARAFGKDGILAYNVAPGFTRTAMAQDFIDQYGEDYAVNDIALQQLTEPSDIAPTVVFLASGLAKHATGATIDINAGSYVH
ncbi:MAG: SDR family oxidoreductase [Bacteroidota bacterium]